MFSSSPATHAFGPSIPSIQHLRRLSNFTTSGGQVPSLFNSPPDSATPYNGTMTTTSSSSQVSPSHHNPHLQQQQHRTSPHSPATSMAGSDQQQHQQQHRHNSLDNSDNCRVLHHYPPPPPPPLPPLTPLAFVDRIMTPLGGGGIPQDAARRRGRQATACLECNRRKQKCDRLQPCHHCAKRNLVDGCKYPDVGATQTQSPSKRKASSSHGSDDDDLRSPRRRGDEREIGILQHHSQHHQQQHHDSHHGRHPGLPLSLPPPSQQLPPGYRLNTGCEQHDRHEASSQVRRQNTQSHHHNHHHHHPKHGSSPLSDSESSSSGGSSSSNNTNTTASSAGRSLSVPELTPDVPTHTPSYHAPIGAPVLPPLAISSERHDVVTPPPPPQWMHYGPAGWRQASRSLIMPPRNDVPPPTTRPPLRARVSAVRNEIGPNQRHDVADHMGYPHPQHQHQHQQRNDDPLPRSPHRIHDWDRVEDRDLMQEGGAPGIGSLAMEGAEEHGDQFQFYGTSHFGPRLAAQVMHGGTSAPDVTDSPYRASGDAELLRQIRQLDSALPKRSLCGKFVTAFFEKHNSWVDILYAPNFIAKTTWFWETHSEFEDLTRIDLRWFALFHTVLAFGVLLDKQADLRPAERQAISDKCFVSARRALSEAPSFYGESLDTVAAYTLLSIYLVSMRRMPESWHMIGSAVRAAQAQGFQVDGETWHLVPKQAELWRRLWAHLYILDRSISYFLGRPLAIQDGSFTTRTPANIPDAELDILPRVDLPLTTTTKSTFLILHFKLAQIIGQILTSCFGLNPRSHAHVMRCEGLMQTWQANLPPVFQLENPDLSLDEHFPWLRLQRRTLMSKYHQARISLHRPYLLPSGRAEYAESRMCCVASAGLELRHRLSLLETDDDPFDRFKWLTVASGFSPACVLGLLLARAKRESGFNYDAIRELLQEYIQVEKNTKRRDHTLENEIGVLEMMLSQAAEVDAKVRSVAATALPTAHHSRGGSGTITPPPQEGQQQQMLPIEHIEPYGVGHQGGGGGGFNEATTGGGAPQPPVLGHLGHPRQLPFTFLSPVPAATMLSPPPEHMHHPHLHGGHNHNHLGHPHGHANYFSSLSLPTLTALAPEYHHHVQQDECSAASAPAGGGGRGGGGSLPASSMHAGVSGAGAFATLAPAPMSAPMPSADDDAARWFAFPSPMDPSADSFPPVHDVSAWLGLLESIGPPTDLVDE